VEGHQKLQSLIFLIAGQPWSKNFKFQDDQCTQVVNQPATLTTTDRINRLSSSSISTSSASLDEQCSTAKVNRKCVRSPTQTIRSLKKRSKADP
jgi:hypothetical protein